jgi:hypothetical protein
VIRVELRPHDSHGISLSRSCPRSVVHHLRADLARAVREHGS